MAAVHRYEGTVNQVMGDGIMALFGAPPAHEDHAVRACYAALAMQEAIGRYADERRRQQGLDVQNRIGLNSGEVVVRSIVSDLYQALEQAASGHGQVVAVIGEPGWASLGCSGSLHSLIIPTAADPGESLRVLRQGYRLPPGH